MWSLISAAEAVFKPEIPQTDGTLPFLYHSETTSSSSSTTINKVTSPAQSLPLCCCSNHQIPTSHPTSQPLTIFLQALNLHQQQLKQPSTTPSTPSLFRPDSSSTSSPIPNKQTIIEFETSTDLKKSRRTFQQRYFVSTRNLRGVDVELEGAFCEVSLEMVEAMRAERRGKQVWEFLKRDEVAKERVSWSCDGCGCGYWVRVVGVGEYGLW